MLKAISTAIHYWPYFIGGGVVVYLFTISKAYLKAGLDPILKIEESGVYKSQNEAWVKTNEIINNDYMLRDDCKSEKDENGFDITLGYGTKEYRFISDKEE
jgi:hypothetical protein